MGITPAALLRRLEEEKHAVYGRQVRTWLGEWSQNRLVRQRHDGTFLWNCRAGCVRHPHLVPCRPVLRRLPRPGRGSRRR
ncbi:hypothetical protein SSCG_03682 [Streptomyces clavuligerus]|nr:hypothetical protein SSCG_03682 [Streptomyces clavuligerus]